VTTDQATDIAGTNQLCHIEEDVIANRLALEFHGRTSHMGEYH